MKDEEPSKSFAGGSDQNGCLPWIPPAEPESYRDAVMPVQPQQMITVERKVAITRR